MRVSPYATPHLVTVAAVPLMVGYGFSADPFNLPKLALLSLATGVGIAAALWSGRSFRRARTVLVPVAAASLPLLASWLVSPWREWTFFGRSMTVQGLWPAVALALFALSLTVVLRRVEIVPLGWALVASATIVAAYVIAQVAGWDPLDWGTVHGSTLEGSSTLGNPNFTGGFLAVVVPLALQMVLRAPRRIPALVCSALLVLGLYFTRSEAAIGAALAGCLVVAGLASRERWRAAPAIAVLIAGLIAAALVGSVALAVMNENVASDHDSLRLRGSYWIAAAGVGIAHPLLGAGPEGFANEGVRHRTIDDAMRFGYSFPNEPHSLPLATFASSGLLGLVGLGVLIAWFIRRGRDAAMSEPLAAGFVGGGVAYLVASLVGTDQLAMRLILWTGVAVIGSTAAKTEDATATRPAFAARAAAALALLLGVAVGGSLIVSDRFVRIGNERQLAGDSASAADAYSDALTLRNDADYRLSRARAVVGAVEELPPEQALASVGEAFAFAESYRDPAVVSEYARIILSYEPTRSSSEAVALFAEALRLDGANPLIRAEMAVALARAGDTSAAIGLLDPIIFYSPPWPQYWGAQALVSALAEQPTTARSHMGVALSMDPDQPEALEARRILRNSADL